MFIHGPRVFFKKKTDFTKKPRHQHLNCQLHPESVRTSCKDTMESTFAASSGPRWHKYFFSSIRGPWDPRSEIRFPPLAMGNKNVPVSCAGCSFRYILILSSHGILVLPAYPMIFKIWVDLYSGWDGVNPFAGYTLPSKRPTWTSRIKVPLGRTSI